MLTEFSQDDAAFCAKVARRLAEQARASGAETLAKLRDDLARQCESLIQQEGE